MREPFGLLLALGLATQACRAPAPRVIAYGDESCARCHMAITDPRYAAELVTTSGQVEVFDDIGCLAAYVRAATTPSARIHSLWVHSVTAPDQWLDARTAFYLERSGASTPMASGILAFATRSQADSASRASGGKVLGWAEILSRRVEPGDRPG